MERSRGPRDVSTDEPLDPEIPRLQTENVVVTPHLGAATRAAQGTAAAVDPAEQVLAAAEERPGPVALNLPSIESSEFQRFTPYIEINETAEGVAGHLLDARLAPIEVRDGGGMIEGDVDPVSTWKLKGVFAPIASQVKAVNPSRIAHERGVTMIETKTRETDEFQGLIPVTVGNGDTTLSASGTRFPADAARIDRVDGVRVDAVPHGRMIVTRNDHVPDVIGLIGSKRASMASTVLGGRMHAKWSAVYR